MAAGSVVIAADQLGLPGEDREVAHVLGRALVLARAERPDLRDPAGLGDPNTSAVALAVWFSSG
jgi:hypothetical protein